MLIFTVTQHITPNSSSLCLSISAIPDAMVLSSTFQGAAATAESQRPPLNLDFPQWNGHATLEDMALTCQRPTTVSTFTTCGHFSAVERQKGFLNCAVCLCRWCCPTT